MLSAVLTVWNEASNLPRVLSSIKGLVDEIVVVVDDATTDGSDQIAKSYGAKVFKHPHTGFVEPMRNFSISKAKGDWILLLDADEEVPASLRETIRAFVSSPGEHSYLKIPRKNIIFGSWITSEHWWPDYVYRLFKKDKVKWSHEIHSTPTFLGSGHELPANENIALIHHHYTTISEYLEKIDRYTTAQLDNIKDTIFDWKLLIKKPSQEFISQFFARQGYKNGVHGLGLSLLQAFSELILYLKLWQSQGFRSMPTNPSEARKTANETLKDFTWWYREVEIKSHPQKSIWHKLLRKIGV